MHSTFQQQQLQTNESFIVVEWVNVVFLMLGCLLVSCSYCYYYH